MYVYNNSLKYFDLIPFESMFVVSFMLLYRRGYNYGGRLRKITTIMSAYAFIEVIELNYISVTVVKMRQD